MAPNEMREQMGGSGAVLAVELERVRAAATSAETVVLVEGTSDRRAVEALALRHGNDLAAVAIIPTAGATNLPRFLEVLAGFDVSISGLCDQGEELDFRLALERAGLGPAPDRKAMEALGFFVCIRDLEEELVRALGGPAMLELMELQGDLKRFRSFQNQPAQRHKTLEAQIWRWLGNHKIRYAPLMVEALDLDRAPQPLNGLLASL